MSTKSTFVSQHVNAPREKVYRALIDADAIAVWKAPPGMTAEIHELDAREGGTFRISLTYREAAGAGKTTGHTDTYHGRFVRLVPNEQVVETYEFETEDPSMRGEMTGTITLIEVDGGTEIQATHEGLPPGLSAADNETGWRESLAQLAALVEGTQEKG